MRLNRSRQVVDAYEDSASMREVFQDKPVRHRDQVGFTWPAEVQMVGKCDGILYKSNKWEKGNWHDYKHVAEAPQNLMVVERGIGDFVTDESLDVVGPWVELPSPMPRQFAKLAKFLGLQFRLFSSFDGRRTRVSRQHMEMHVPGAYLGGAFVPDEDDMTYPTRANLTPGEPFLFVYTLDAGVHCIITGRELAVERDGIVG